MAKFPEFSRILGYTAFCCETCDCNTSMRCVAFVLFIFVGIWLASSGATTTGSNPSNPCTIQNGGCSFMTTCSNLGNGSVVCGPCPTGYVGDGHVCTSLCGDGMCDASNGENCVSCPLDCPISPCGVCGDDVCGLGENCISCFSDCGACVGATTTTGGPNGNPCEMLNGGCSLLTTCSNLGNGSVVCGPCPIGYFGDGHVCTTLCGDGICDASIRENCVSCPYDCPISPCRVCGDGECDSGETCSSCFSDCGTCSNPCEISNGGCSEMTICTNLGNGSVVCGPCPIGYIGDGRVCTSLCGDAVCDVSAGENCVTCPIDCASPCGVCGDSICDLGENCTSCFSDCGACVPSTTTSAPPTTGPTSPQCVIENGGCSLLVTCTMVDGNVICGPCPPDTFGDGHVCTSLCGDHVCNASIGENCVSCPLDCPASPCGICGDDVCDSGETCTSCFSDCGACEDLCAINNGGCSDLVTCYPIDGKAVCGYCPPGTFGDGYVCVNSCGDGICNMSMGESCVNCVDCEPCYEPTVTPVPTAAPQSPTTLLSGNQEVGATNPTAPPTEKQEDAGDDKVHNTSEWITAGASQTTLGTGIFALLFLFSL